MSAAGGGSLHSQVAEHYRTLIQSGELQPGDRLPTYREMVERHGVSRATVQTAIGALRAEGLVTGATKGGTVVADQNDAVSVEDWDAIRAIALEIHDRVESEFAPDLVVTMSGPGGFAAFLTMAYSARLVPTMAAVTFPARDPMPRAERLFAEAAKLDTWRPEGGRSGPTLATDKWRVYLPRLIGKLPAGTRVLLLDDRVLSGTTQKVASGHMTEAGLDVRTAALFGSADSAAKVDYLGQVIADRFRMPWGTDRGRT